MTRATQPIGFHFRERMIGPLAASVDDPQRGAALGRSAGTTFVADLRVGIEDLAACVRDPQHTAGLSGTASFPSLATAQPISEGRLMLYVPDPTTGAKLMRYRFAFRSDAGASYFLDGTKVIHTPRASAREQVTLYTRIHAGSADGPVWGAGVLVFRLRDLPGFLLSMRADGATRLQGLRSFIGFARHELTTPVVA